MSGCCDVTEQAKQKTYVLLTVLVINAIMFFAQFFAAMVAHSTALLADSMDMLGDVLAYAVSLYAIGRGEMWLAKAAFFKGAIIALFGLVIFFEAGYKLLYMNVVPNSSIMAIFSTLGLFANGICLYLLTRHRDQDINMRSTWICARNDIIGNVSVLLTAGLVFLLQSRWPDIIVGVSLAFVLLYSAIGVLKASLAK